MTTEDISVGLENYGFRVAVFGETGSGKSTIVSKLCYEKKLIRWLEMSRDVIGQDLSSFKGSYEEKRAFGKRLFDQYSNLEGQGWAAKRVIKLTKDDQFSIVTGVRGVENIRLLKKAGFFCIFIDCEGAELAKRISQRTGVDEKVAASIIEEESAAYNTPAVRQECDLVIDNGGEITRATYELYNACFSVSRLLAPLVSQKFCLLCSNSQLNVDLFANGSEICNVCRTFRSVHNVNQLLNVEREDILSRIKAECTSGRPILVGISGGKDSSLMLASLCELSSNVHAFTIDTGYYPQSIVQRSKQISEKIGCQHTIFDARTQLTDEIRDSYHRTAELFDNIELGRPHDLGSLYKFTRKHYSIREDLTAPYPRPCQLCRRLVIRSYYDLAISMGARYVFLGINEWVNLSASAASSFEVSGIRRLQPTPESQAVYVIHWPFLNRSNIEHSKKKLDEMGWIPPFGEGLIETNANSCLFAKASESQFANSLGFHPDSTRLAREVTAGFLDRKSALRALSTVNRSPWSVRDVLTYAGILD